MIKIKINASDEIREVTFSRHSEHVIELGGIADAPTTGFTTWRMDGVTQLGDFSDYTTVYRTLDNAVQLSDRRQCVHRAGSAGHASAGRTATDARGAHQSARRPERNPAAMHPRDERDCICLKIFGLLVMSGKEEDMMAMIWAQQIMLGKKTYAQVPRLLKDKVKEVLIDSGCEDLVTE